MALLLETDLGDLVIDLDVEGSPSLAKNVLKLAKARFYTKTLIHSVTPNRFCQLGCPIGNGTGGTSIYGLLDHTTDGDYRKSSKRFLKSSSVGRYLTPTECQEKGRVVACLAGGGSIPDTIGSQFLITTAEGPDYALDGYTIPAASGRDSSVERSVTGFLSLGVVVEDENGVLDRINEAYTDRDGRPYADIRILRALVVEDPFEDPPGMGELLARRGVVLAENGDDGNSRVIDSPSPERPPEETVPARISIKEVEDEQGVEDEEVLRAREEEAQRKEDRSRAVVLEMLGDLPSADITAPENVLFICKLNPATQDEDLELIFSRFDPSVKVEIIRDHDTGNSLQYAFAEFSTKEQAEEAYFKMDNALVDDRRIKVDFSQSVSKIWDKYNQKQRMPRGGYGGTFPTQRRRDNDRVHPREQHGNQSSERARDESGRAARSKGDRQGSKHRERGRGSDEHDRNSYHRRHSNEDDGSERQRRNDHRHRQRSPENHHQHRGHGRHDNSSPESREHRREHKRYKRSRSVDEKDSYRKQKHRDRDSSASRKEYDRYSKHDDRHARRYRESSRNDDGSHFSTDRHRRHRDESEESYRQRKRRKEHKRHDKGHKSRKHSRHYDREPREDREGKQDRKRHRSRHRSPS